MPVSMAEARILCTKPELALVRESTAAAVKRLPPHRLRTNIDKARQLRDKYRDLASQQRREQRGKGTVRGTRPSQGNERTVQKQHLFAQALEAFETQLASLAGRGSGSSPKAGRPSPRQTKRIKAADRRSERRGSRQAVRAVEAVTRKGRASAARQGRDELPPTVAADASGTTHPEPISPPVLPPVPPASENNTIQAPPAAPKAGPKTKSAASRKKGSPTPLGSIEAMAARNEGLQRHSQSTKGMRVRKGKQRANASKIRGHVSGRGRRSQARRDAR